MTRIAVYLSSALLVATVAPAHAQRPKLASSVHARVDDAPAERRVATFLTAVADSLDGYAARMSGERAPRGGSAWLFSFASLYTDFGETGGHALGHETVQSPLARLDSLRTLWMATAPVARGEWLYRESGIEFLSKSLTPLLLQGKLANGAEQLARAMERTGDRLAQGAAHEGSGARSAESATLARTLSSEGRLLRVAVQVARGDTAAAIPALLALTRVATTNSAHRAGEMLLSVAEARRDPSLRITATTLAYLMNAGTDSLRKKRLYATLQTLYPEYVSARGTVPDVFPNVMEPRPEGQTPLALDAYLDRQFGVLYDRFIPVTRASLDPVPPGRTPRIVLAEYATGVFCGSCWEEDRAFSAVSRRYPFDRVIPLGYHDYFPVSRVIDSTWTRFGSWYPSSFVPFGGKLPATAVSRQSIVSPRGDTLTDIYVDGIGIPRHGPGAEAMYATASVSIDAALQRAPTARVQLRVTRDKGMVTFTTTVDSVVGRHDRLAFRAVLMQDTVTLRGGTNRRIYTNVVRATLHSDGLSLGLPLDVAGGAATVTRSFDVDEINRTLLGERDPVTRARAQYGANASAAMIEQALDYSSLLPTFPDDRDWHLDMDRLFVIAFVQDLETGEILQAAMARVPR